MRRLLYIIVGIFVVVDLAYRINLPGQSPRQSRDQSSGLRQPPAGPGEVRRQERRPGPKVWTKLTDDWGPGAAVSKRHEFPAYDDPVAPVGTIRGRSSDPKRTVGSAFAIAENGVWLTARHVVDGCLEVGLQAGLRRGKPATLPADKIIIHPKADVALMTSSRTDYGREAFQLAGTTAPGEAFHIGFPRGQPGTVHSRFLGQKRVRHQNVEGSEEDALVWAEISRVPDFSGALGGISGGVVVDRTGAVIGTNSAGNPRRGRLITSQTTALKDVLRQIGQRAQDAPARSAAIAELNARDYPSFAKAAIQDRRVVRVVCVRRRG